MGFNKRYKLIKKKIDRIADMLTAEQVVRLTSQSSAAEIKADEKYRKAYHMSIDAHQHMKAILICYDTPGAEHLTTPE